MADTLQDLALAAHHYAPTDAGNAEFFRSMYGDLVRFDHKRARWLVWNGHYWRPDDNEALHRMALNSVRERQRAVVNADDIPTSEREQLVKHAIRSETKSRLDALLSIASTLLPIADNGEGWDLTPGVLGCENGVIDLRTGELRNGQPSDRVTLSTGIEYDPGATCPRWETLVAEILQRPAHEDRFEALLSSFQETTKTVTYMQRLAGATASGEGGEEVVVFLMGTGSNGKSTLLRKLKQAVGGYALELEATALLATKQKRHSTEVADLERMRLGTCEEVGNETLNAGRLKHLSGGRGAGETKGVRARSMYRSSHEFPITWLLWITTNGQPKADDNTWGFWRRVRAIDFPNKYDKADEPTLEKTLTSELPGILAWVVRGAVAWYAEGLGEVPAAIEQATAEYRHDLDPLEPCFEAEILVADEEARTSSADLLAAYRTWAHATEAKGVLTNDSFAKALAGRFPKCKVGAMGAQVRGYVGVKVGVLPEPPVTRPDDAFPAWRDV
jgi:putative DNA primase/helicase